MTWIEEIFPRLETAKSGFHSGLVRKFSHQDLLDILSSVEGGVRDDISEALRGSFSQQLYNGWFLDYNPWLKVLSLVPQLHNEEFEYVREVNAASLDQQIKSHIQHLSPYAFEMFVIDLLRATKKYSRVSPSKQTRDGGKDFIAYFRGENDERRVLIGEVKKWKKPVPEAVIDRLAATMKREAQRLPNPPLGVLITLHGASDIAAKTADTERIEVWDINTLTRLVKKHKLGLSQISLDLPDPDYWSELDGI